MLFTPPFPLFEAPLCYLLSGLCFFFICLQTDSYENWLEFLFWNFDGTISPKRDVCSLWPGLEWWLVYVFQKTWILLKFIFYLVEASFRSLALSSWTVAPTRVLPPIQREKLRKPMCFPSKVRNGEDAGGAELVEQWVNMTLCWRHWDHITT